MNINEKALDKYHPAGHDFRKNNFPFYWLAMTSHCYTQAMTKILKSIDLDINRYRILFTLKEERYLSLSDIAYHSLCKLPTATKIVYRMQSAGLLVTRQNEYDGRIIIVSLTNDGESIICEAEKEIKKLYSKAFWGMTENQIIELNALLRILHGNFLEP